jgi:hypothetical protein
MSGASILLLPERRRFEPMIPLALAKRLGRADRLPLAEAGERAQLLRYFEIAPKGRPMAAITRQADAGDAADYAWLRADPVYIRPDIGGARLMAWGTLGLSPVDAGMFIEALAPMFSDAGFPISATAPERWYLRLPGATSMPAFAPPTDILGDDLFRHLPEGPDARSWRALLNEAQIVLHNHPRNIERVAAGLPPINSVWFWGGGTLPDAVHSPVRRMIGEDDELSALAKLAGADVMDANETILIDLRRARTWAVLEAAIGETAPIENRTGEWLLDFADGVRLRIRRTQRWRFWRRPLAAVDA